MTQLVKNHLQCGRAGFNPWVGKILWRRERLLTPVFWPREFHGMYSPWGHKESETTDFHRLSYSVNITSLYRETKKSVWLALSRYLLYRGGLELSPKQLQGLPVVLLGEDHVLIMLLSAEGCHRDPESDGLSSTRARLWVGCSIRRWKGPC